MKETDYYDLMKDFEAEEIEPMVGIFWFLPEEHRLFEVYASSLSQSKMVKGNFIVKVGSWYEPYEAELRELVEDAFNLPDDFVFEIGKHWELGHGWNEDQLDDFFGD